MSVKSKQEIKEKEIKEEWMSAPGYSRYKFSDLGRIKALRYNRILKLGQVHNKYIRYGLINDEGFTDSVTVHRIIAEIYIPNPKNKSQVNHKDSNIINNKVSNLEWVTPEENIRHAVKNKKPKERLKVIILSDISGFVPCNLEGYEHYKINEKGILISRSNRVVNGTKDRAGYIRVELTNKKLSLGTAIHRIVAITFIPNLENKSCVNHINGIRDDNRMENLEWATPSENSQHYHDNIKVKEPYGRDIYQLELDGSIIKEFESIKDAEKELKVQCSIISSVCSNYDNGFVRACAKTFYGYGWCWKESYIGQIVNPELLRLFPTVDCDNPIINYDKLRPYIIRGSRPIFKLELDGTRLELYHSMSDTNVKNIGMAIERNTTAGGYGWSYATYEDICIDDNPYVALPNYILEKYEIDVFRYNDIDYDLIRESIEFGEGGSPIWEININGIRIKKWCGKTKAKNHYNLGRGTIDQVCFNISYLVDNKIWETATFYKSDNNTEGTYRIIPYKDRVLNKLNNFGNKLSKMVEQYSEGKLIDTMSQKEVFGKVGFYLSLSYKFQNGFEFKLIDKKKKQNKHIIVQLTEDKKVVKLWDDSQQAVANAVKLFTRPQLNGVMNKNRILNGFRWRYLRDGENLEIGDISV